MSRYLTVPVLWNENGSFQNSSLVSIDIQSRLVGTAIKPTMVYPPAVPPPSTTTTLQVEDPNHGTLYLNMPLQSYQDAIRAASGSAAPLVLPLIIHIVGSTTTVTNSALSGATLVSVWVNGATLDLTTLTLSGDTLTFPFTLSDTDVVGIIYYTS